MSVDPQLLDLRRQGRMMAEEKYGSGIGMLAALVWIGIGSVLWSIGQGFWTSLGMGLVAALFVHAKLMKLAIKIEMSRSD